MLSIIIPVHNEKYSIGILLKKIIKITKIKKEIIIIDDASNDGTTEILKKDFLKLKSIKKIIFLKKNIGKGGAIKFGRKFINGDYVAIQDGDLEYNPNDLVKIYNILKKKNLDIVYGSRVLGKKVYKNSKNLTHLFRIFCNNCLTIISNIVNRQKLTDAHTCYKVFRSKIFKNLKLNENGFAFCPEITTKVSIMGYKITEVPISYNPRSYREGKKIKTRDGFDAIYCLIKYRLLR